LGIDTDGKGWSWGADTNGQLGNGDSETANKTSPFPIDTPSPHPGTWTQLSAGSSHSLGIDTDGKGWSWGLDTNGQLGNGGAEGNKTSPFPIDTPSPHPGTWAQLDAGNIHSLGIDTNSKGWSWGSDNFGQLGNGDSETAIKTSPFPINTPSPHPGTWAQLSAGNNYSLGLDTNGKGWSWGLNQLGQLGLGDGSNRSEPVEINLNVEQPPNQWKHADAGYEHSLAIDEGNNGWAWGSDQYGKLGNEYLAPQPIPTRIIGSITWSNLSAGKDHSIGIDDENNTWVWGRNQFGQLGLGNTNDVTTGPMQYVSPETFVSGSAGSDHTILVSDDGKIYAAGSNAQGQLGLGDTITNSTSFTEIEVPSQDSGWTVSSAGHQHTVAINEQTGLWSWGANNFDQLGLGIINNPIYEPTLSPYLIVWQRTLTSSEIARTKFVRRYGLSPINPNLKLFSTTPGSNQAWIPAGNGSSQLILWRRGIDNEEI
jgi:alpha-tubulin suppressor-like RCC1 family protein